jgi:uncharacterized membrane protein
MAGVETLARGDDSRLVQPRRFLIRDRESFAAVYAAHAGQDAAVPAVDFETRMVAAVFAGERPTPGFSVEVIGTRREGSALVVLVEEKGEEGTSDPGRVTAQVVVSPFHLVTLPRDDGEIRFNLPDPGGLQTIVFKPHPRHAISPATSVARQHSSALDSLALDAGEAASAYTGLTPRVAASLAYLAGPLSGALLLATEPASRFVRFHAWQAILALGLLCVAAVAFLGLAFVLLLMSPTAFWTMLWLSAATGAAWIAVWGLCVVSAYKGRALKLPLAGRYASRQKPFTAETAEPAENQT